MIYDLIIFGKKIPLLAKRGGKLLFDGVFLFSLTASLLYSGNLDNSNPPSQTMVTIDDIYNKISSGTVSSAHSLLPNNPPGSTGHNFQFIYGSLAGGYQTTAFESDVIQGKTFIKRSGGSITYSTGTLQMQNYALPDTGQTQSYTATFGEDNDYQPANTQPSYTDNGNGTITDNRTGLIWVKDGNSAGCNNGNTLTWESALTFCENLNYAGLTDWRLPNVKELVSLVDYSRSNPSINVTYFPNTASINGTTICFYWTSTTYVPLMANAWLVSFVDGYLDSDTKTHNNYVRPVRGGQ